VLLEINKKRLSGAQIVVVSGAYQPIVEAFARKMEIRVLLYDLYKFLIIFVDIMMNIWDDQSE